MKLERLLQILMVAALGLLVAVVVSTIEERVVVAGDTAPNFSITTDSGRKITRSDFGGKVLVLNFWATWCPPCIEEIPSLEQFHKQLSGAGVVVLAVSVDRNAAQYSRFLERAGITFLTARDPEAEISSRYGTFKYPESYIIDRRGKVVQKIIGATNWTDPRMINYIRSLL
jgi:cytochrome c biogenesis protein CcmG/thiol:disulfide interchange protein DsbE